MTNVLLGILVGLNFLILIIISTICSSLTSNQSTKNTLSPDDFAGCLAILNAIIQNEFDAYEVDIFSHKGSITNSNFENYYHDITNKIIEKIPEEFIKRMSDFYTVDGIYSHIARRVKIFLTSKINPVTEVQ